MPDRQKHFLIENSIFDPVNIKSAATGPAEQKELDGKALDVPPNRRIIVYAGTLEPYQGIDLLLESFAEMRKSLDGVFLLIVGGQAEQVAAYKKMAQSLGLNEDCKFTGRVPQQEAKAYCAIADVQVSPRTSGTNTPLKVYEQLANGIPLVATHIYSHTQVLNESVAILVEPERRAMAEGLIQALSDRDDTNKRLLAAKDLYDEKYSRNAYVSKMQQLLRVLT